jgi:hypothetical protein
MEEYQQIEGVMQKPISSKVPSTVVSFYVDDRPVTAAAPFGIPE